MEEEELPFPPSYSEFGREVICKEPARSSTVLSEPTVEYQPEGVLLETVPLGSRLWKRILKEHREENKATQKYLAKKEKRKNPKVKLPKNPRVEFLKKVVFPPLLNGMEEALRRAEECGAIRGKKTTFDATDFVVEYLYNMKEEVFVPFFDIPFVKKHIEENLKSEYTLCWYLSDDEAARIIQRNVRGWLVRKIPEVFEMRQFWKVICRKWISSFIFKLYKTANRYSWKGIQSTHCNANCHCLLYHRNTHL